MVTACRHRSFDFAARLLPHIAPEKDRGDYDDLLGALAGEGSVGVIAADNDIPELHRALFGSGIQHAVLAPAIWRPRASRSRL